MNPKVTVLFPVYNGERYLETSINSILGQTFRDFELLILLEFGSNQASRDIVERLQDSRIRIIENEKKLGLAKSLNAGIKVAQGEYIARMDADDISMPKRFAYQVSFLDKHKDIVMCGTAMQGIYEDGSTDKRGYFTDPDSIKFECMLGNPFGHPTVMFRKREFIENDFFYRNTPYSEDFELWKRVVEVYPCANLPQFLLQYRLHGESASAIYGNILNDVNQELNREYLIKRGIDYDIEQSFWQSNLTEQEIEKREHILVAICNLWDNKRAVRKVLEQRMRLFYMGNHIPVFSRFWSTFSFVYKNSTYDCIRLWISFTAHRIVGVLRG